MFLGKTERRAPPAKSSLLPFPNLGNDQRCEFLCDLLERFVSDATLGPGTQRGIHPAAALHSGLQGLQIVPCALGMHAFRMREGLVIPVSRQTESSMKRLL